MFWNVIVLGLCSVTSEQQVKNLTKCCDVNREHTLYFRQRGRLIITITDQFIKIKHLLSVISDTTIQLNDMIANKPDKVWEVWCCSFVPYVPQHGLLVNCNEIIKNGLWKQLCKNIVLNKHKPCSQTVHQLHTTCVYMYTLCIMETCLLNLHFCNKAVQMPFHSQLFMIVIPPFEQPVFHLSFWM